MECGGHALSCHAQENAVALSAIAINCSLSKTRSRKSSTDAMIAVLAEHSAEHDVEVTESIRIADHDVTWGVSSNEGRAMPGPIAARGSSRTTS